MNNEFFIERKKCPICDSQSLKKIYEIPYSDERIKAYLNLYYKSQGFIEFDYLENVDYILEECQKCNFIFQKMIPKELLLNKLYREWIDPNKNFNFKHSKKSLEYYVHNAEEIVRIISHFNKYPSKLKIFDYGMGWGKWISMVKSFGCEAYGFDLDSARMEFAKINGVNVISYNAIPNYKFNFINTEQVFEHLVDPYETLCYLKTALQSKGIIKISVPNCENLKRELKHMHWDARINSGRSFKKVTPLEHINCFNYESLIMMADSAGLRLIEIPLYTNFLVGGRFNFKEFNIADSAKIAQEYFDNFKSILTRYRDNNTYLFFTHK